jgi:hypothetical protein
MAAKEIRRYLCLRTGLLWPLRLDDAAPEQNWILVGTKHRRSVQTLLADPALKESVQGLAEQEFVLRTVRHGNRVVWLIAGGDGIGAFYGAYRFAEHLGVRFYLHGDVLPDTQTALQLPDLNEIAKPLFRLRGIQPFHDFPEGPDWWNADAYKAVLGQLPKLRMNFFGLHTYPAGQVGPEPTVWIGLAGEIGPGATVKLELPGAALHHPKHSFSRGQTGLGLSASQNRRLLLRRRRLALRLHRLDGHPLAHSHCRAKHLRPGPGRLGPNTLEIPTNRCLTPPSGRQARGTAAPVPTRTTRALH